MSTTQPRPGVPRGAARPPALSGAISASPWPPSPPQAAPCRTRAPRSWPPSPANTPPAGCQTPAPATSPRRHPPSPARAHPRPASAQERHHEPARAPRSRPAPEQPMTAASPAAATGSPATPVTGPPADHGSQPRRRRRPDGSRISRHRRPAADQRATAWSARDCRPSAGRSGGGASQTAGPSWRSPARPVTSPAW
jgi:hypothetical protein